MVYLHAAKLILAPSLLALLFAGCGITGSKQNSSPSSPSSVDEKASPSDSLVAQGAFSLTQPDLSSNSIAMNDGAAPTPFDIFEVRLIPDRGASAKDYIKRVPYAPGSSILFDHIIAGSYKVEVQLYANDIVVMRGTASTFVKRDDAVKIDVDLKHVEEH